MKILTSANKGYLLWMLGFSMLRTPLANIIGKLTQSLQVEGYRNK